MHAYCPQAGIASGHLVLLTNRPGALLGRGFLFPTTIHLTTTNTEVRENKNDEDHAAKVNVHS
jgi:hypothetical protein